MASATLIDASGNATDVEAEMYVSALDLHAFTQVAPDLSATPASQAILDGFGNLRLDDMNGIMLFFKGVITVAGCDKTRFETILGAVGVSPSFSLEPRCAVRPASKIKQILNTT